VIGGGSSGSIISIIALLSYLMPLIAISLIAGQLLPFIQLYLFLTGDNYLLSFAQPSTDPVLVFCLFFCFSSIYTYIALSLLFSQI
jgi:hypothetical protein